MKIMGRERLEVNDRAWKDMCRGSNKKVKKYKGICKTERRNRRNWMKIYEKDVLERREGTL